MARVVDPGRPSTPERVGTPPSDAVVLFDGKDLSRWRSDKDGSAAKWKVADGTLEVAAGTGDIRTEQGFGDAQVHVEWMAPLPGEAPSADATERRPHRRRGRRGGRRGRSGGENPPAAPEGE